MRKQGYLFDGNEISKTLLPSRWQLDLTLLLWIISGMKGSFLLFNFLFSYSEKFFTFIISILIIKAVGLSRVTGSRKCV